MTATMDLSCHIDTLVIFSSNFFCAKIKSLTYLLIKFESTGAKYNRRNKPEEAGGSGLLHGRARVVAMHAFSARPGGGKLSAGDHHRHSCLLFALSSLSLYGEEPSGSSERVDQGR